MGRLWMVVELGETVSAAKLWIEVEDHLRLIVAS